MPGYLLQGKAKNLYLSCSTKKEKQYLMHLFEVFFSEFVLFIFVYVFHLPSTFGHLTVEHEMIIWPQMPFMIFVL